MSYREVAGPSKLGNVLVQEQQSFRLIKDVYIAEEKKGYLW